VPDPSDATKWDDLVTELGLTGLARQRQRHTALTWMANADVDLHCAAGRPDIRIRRSGLATCISTCRPC
jgi:hypothetical protein